MKFSKFSFIVATISNATPAVITSVAHELYEDDVIWFETTGTLPTGFSVETDYYVIREGITADTFQLSARKQGSPVATTAAGSGVHSWIKTNRANLTPFTQDAR